MTENTEKWVVLRADKPLALIVVDEVLKEMCDRFPDVDSVQSDAPVWQDIRQSLATIVEKYLG